MSIFDLSKFAKHSPIHTVSFGRRLADTTTFLFKDVGSNTIESFLSEFNEDDGNLGLEMFKQNDSNTMFFFHHSRKSVLTIFDTAIRPMIDMGDLNNASCFTLNNSKSPCFPFLMSDCENVWGYVKKYTSKHKEQIFLQILLCKKTNEQWQMQYRRLYYDYTNGIELPTTNKMLRYAQYKMLDLLVKINQHSFNPDIEDAERKLEQDGFRCEVRFIIRGGTKESRNKIADKIKLAFSVTNSFNTWELNEIKLKEKFIENIVLRRFSLVKNEQIMCMSEILPLFTVSQSEQIAPEPIEISSPKVDEATQVEIQKNTKANNIYSIFPKGKKVERDDDVNLPVKFNKALRKLKLLKGNVEDAIVQKIQHGTTLRKITISLPEGLSLKDLQSNVSNIQTELGIAHMGVEQGQSEGTAAITIPQDARELVYLGDLLENKEFVKYVKEAILPFIIGVDTVGELIFDDLTRVKHLLVCGATGGGKSVFLNCLLVVLLLFRSPAELQLLLLDPKKVELSSYRQMPHVVDVITDNKKAYYVLSAMVVKMEERYDLLAKRGYKNIQQFNKKEKDKLSYIVVVIDEFADLIMTVPEIEGVVVLIAQKARAAGIHIVLCTQKPVVDVITGLIKDNIYSRVCFLCASGTAYKVAIDEVPKFELLGRGDGIFRFEGINKLVRFQSPLISLDDNEQDSILEKVANYWKNGNYRKEDIPIDKVQKLETELDKLKRIVAETGEVKVAKLRELMGIKNTRLQKLMEQLTDEGWVDPPKIRSQGYKLLLSDEDRKKYLQN